MNDEFNNLAVAIVEQAIVDYMNARVMQMKENCQNPRDYRENPNEYMVKTCLYFFYSDWYLQLCNIPSDKMIEMLEQEAKERISKRGRKKKETS